MVLTVVVKLEIFATKNYGRLGTLPLPLSYILDVHVTIAVHTRMHVCMQMHVNKVGSEQAKLQLSIAS